MKISFSVFDKYLFTFSVKPYIMKTKKVRNKTVKSHRANKRGQVHMSSLEENRTAIEQIYLDSPVCAALTDENLSVVWCNKACEDRFAFLKFPDGAKNLLAVYHAEDVLERLKQNKTFVTDSQLAPVVGPPAAFAPVFSGGVFSGSIITITPSDEAVTLTDTEGVERALLAISAQFRNPLSVIFSILSTMSRQLEQQNAANMPDLISHISQNCYNMLKYCVNVTSTVRLSHGLPVVSCAKYDITKLFDELSRAIAIMCSSIGIPFGYSLPEEQLFCFCDDDKVAAVILNLVANSCRFTREGNAIALSLTAQNDRAVITVSDKGIGIKPEFLDRIFEPYFAFNPEQTGPSGSGLGLSFCKLAVHAMGGTIAVDSVENEGTRVVFTLPLNHDENAPVELCDSAADYLRDRFSQLFVLMSDVCRCPNA